jgi:hypothetical protein
MHQRKSERINQKLYTSECDLYSSLVCEQVDIITREWTWSAGVDNSLIC